MTLRKCLGMLMLVVSGVVMGQFTGTTAITTTSAGARLGLGTNAHSSLLLRIHNTSLNSHLLLSGGAPALRFGSGTNEEDATIGLATSGGHFLSSAVSGDFVFRNAVAGGILFGTNSGTAEKMRITNDGRVGIGTTTPTSLLNLYGNGVDARLDITSSNATSGSAYSLFNNKFMVGTGGDNFGGTGGITTSGWMLIGGTTSGGSGRMWMKNGGTPQVIFGANPSIVTGTGSKYAGDYIFDGQVSSKTLLVSAPGAVAPTIPAGASFGVLGDAHIMGGSSFVSQYGSTSSNLQMYDMANYSGIKTNGNKPLLIQPSTSYVAIGYTNTTVLGNTLSAEYKLRIKGKIICEELKVQLSSTNWPDYVFDKDYKLASLDSVESYINENKHLPEVPSAEEVKANGIETGQMNAILLKKVEELTLYMIQQQKEIEVLKVKNAEIEKQLKN